MSAERPPAEVEILGGHATRRDSWINRGRPVREEGSGLPDRFGREAPRGEGRFGDGPSGKSTEDSLSLTL